MKVGGRVRAEHRQAKVARTGVLLGVGEPHDGALQRCSAGHPLDPPGAGERAHEHEQRRDVDRAEHRHARLDRQIDRRRSERP